MIKEHRNAIPVHTKLCIILGSVSGRPSAKTQGVGSRKGRANPCLLWAGLQFLFGHMHDLLCKSALSGTGVSGMQLLDYLMAEHLHLAGNVTWDSEKLEHLLMPLPPAACHPR